MRGPEQEAEVPRLGRAAEPRDVHQGGQPGIVAPAHRQQALGDEGAIKALERHHIGHRAERDEIEEAEEVRLRALRRPEPAPAQLAVERNHGHEHEADGGEMAELREIVEPVGIDHRQRRGQPFVGLMMVDHDHVEAELARFSSGSWLVVPQSTATRRRRPSRGERADRFRVRPITFEQAIGNVDEGAQAAMAQVSAQHRRRRRAIDIVVAEDGDRFPAHDRFGSRRRGDAHVGERVRVRHERAHGRVEEARDLVQLDAAAGKNARQQLGHIRRGAARSRARALPRARRADRARRVRKPSAPPREKSAAW